MPPSPVVVDVPTAEAPRPSASLAGADSEPKEVGPGGVPSTQTMEGARDAIISRFLRTHALIGLAEVTARYPVSPAEAPDWLERRAGEGKAQTARTNNHARGFMSGPRRHRL